MPESAAAATYHAEMAVLTWTYAALWELERLEDATLQSDAAWASGDRDAILLRVVAQGASTHFLLIAAHQVVDALDAKPIRREVRALFPKDIREHVGLLRNLHEHAEQHRPPLERAFAGEAPDSLTRIGRRHFSEHSGVWPWSWTTDQDGRLHAIGSLSVAELRDALQAVLDGLGDVRPPG